MNDEIRMSNVELPNEWEAIKLEDIAAWGSGGTPPRKNPKFYGGDIPWIKTGELGDGLILDTEEKITAEGLKNSSAKVFPKGSVGIAMYGATIGKVSILGIDAATNQACAVGIPDLQLTSPQYLFQYLRSQKEAFIAAGKGGAQPNLSQGVIKEWPFPLAPLAEQKRIADKLEAVLGRVDACRTRLDRVPALLKRFRQSVLAAATSGKLTEEWREGRTAPEHGTDVIERDRIKKESLLRGDPSLAKKKSSLESKINEEYLFDLPETWAFTSWGTVSEWITYGFTRPMPQAKSGRRLVTAKDVRNFNLAISTSYFTTETAFNELSDKDRPKRGDLLLTKDGTIGRTTLVRTDEPFCINQSVAVCWLRSTEMEKSYLEIVANAEFTQAFIRDKAQGMAIQHLSITDFAQCPLPVPPLAEQQEIVRRVEDLFAFADRIEARLATAQKAVERLTPATLAKAFRGELVPQDPNDEPAGVLLKKIKSDAITHSNRRNP